MNVPSTPNSGHPKNISYRSSDASSTKLEAVLVTTGSSSKVLPSFMSMSNTPDTSRLVDVYDERQLGIAPITRENRHRDIVKPLLNELTDGAKILLIGVGDTLRPDQVRSPQVCELVEDLSVRAHLTLMDIGEKILRNAVTEAEATARKYEKSIEISGLAADLTTYQFPEHSVDFLMATHVLQYPMDRMIKAKVDRSEFKKLAMSLLNAINPDAAGMLVDTPALEYLLYSIGDFQSVRAASRCIEGSKKDLNDSQHYKNIADLFPKTANKAFQILPLKTGVKNYQQMYNIKAITDPVQAHPKAPQ